MEMIRDDLDSSLNKLLNEYTEILFAFSASKKYLWFVRFAFVFLLVMVLTQISILRINLTDFGNIPTSLYDSNVPIITLLITTLINMIVPIGLLKIYSGAKKKNIKESIVGAKILRIFYQLVFMLILILLGLSILSAIFVLFTFPLLGLVLLVSLLIVSLIYYFIFRTLSRFSSDIESCFREDISSVPTSNKLVWVYIIMIILSLFSLVTIYVGVIKIDFYNAPIWLVQYDLEGLLNKIFSKYKFLYVTQALYYLYLIFFFKNYNRKFSSSFEQIALKRYRESQKNK
ncbi:hypothetical protein ACAG96_08870 [Candidatus Izemoplasma sp. B36]|uniref:hypothetical protein n=1 Tax=Candidatus Izemoplasma sp. B36 TaxID=3242468 RepID=UPI003557645D